MKRKKKTYVAIWSIVLVLVLIVTIVANAAALTWDGALSRLLGNIGETKQPADTSDSVYFTTGYDSAEALESAQREFTERVTAESVVLLKNDGALPLAGNENISLFGLSSKGIVTVGSGSGSSDLDETCTWEYTFESAGFNVNKTLLEFYRNSSHKHGAAPPARTGPSTRCLCPSIPLRSRAPMPATTMWPSWWWAGPAARAPTWPEICPALAGPPTATTSL